MLAIGVGCTCKHAAAPGRSPVNQGDCLDITIINERDPSPVQIRQTVDSAGDIILPFVGKLRVADRTLSETERLIEQAFVLKESSLSITVKRCSPDGRH
jgi:protein involved in polysaccharide export with SLBB domain